MKITIITVCYNSQATIRDTIESVLAQDYPDIEYIIIDGLSKDGTLAIVNEYKEKISLIVSEKDAGIYDAMNKGISLSSGNIIGILNADDWFENNSIIGKIVSEFTKNPSLNVLFGDVIFVDNYSKKPVRHYFAKYFKPWKLRFGFMPPHTGTFVSADLYRKYGGYNLSYRISADYEMFARWFTKQKINYKWVDLVVTKMRIGGASTKNLKARWVLNQEIIRACKQNGIYTNFFFLLFKVPFKLMELIFVRKS